MSERQRADERLSAVSAGIGSSTSADPSSAGRAAAEAAVAKLGGAPPALVVVYASMSYDLPTLIASVRAVTGDAPLLGASTSGQIVDGTLVPPGSGVSVLVLAGDAYRFGVGWVDGLGTDTNGAGRRLASAAMAAIGADRPRYNALLVLADGLAGDMQSLLNGIYHVVGATVPVVGGAAAADRALGETYVFHNDRVAADAAVAVWIGAAHPLTVVSGHGWQATGIPMLVTRVDGHVVHEIDGRPATEIYQECFRNDGPTELLGTTRDPDWHALHAFGLIEPDGSQLIRGATLDEDGNVRTFVPLPPYCAVQIMSARPDRLLACSDQVVADALAGNPARVLLTFSCVARMDILGERGYEEARRLQAAAGDVPTFGFYTYGEFARSTSVSGYHNATITALAL